MANASTSPMAGGATQRKKPYDPRGSHSISFENFRTEVSNSHCLHIVSRTKRGRIFPAPAHSFYNLRPNLRMHIERANRTHGPGSVYMKPHNNSDGIDDSKQHSFELYRLPGSS